MKMRGKWIWVLFLGAVMLSGCGISKETMMA